MRHEAPKHDSTKTNPDNQPPKKHHLDRMKIEIRIKLLLLTALLTCAVGCSMDKLDDGPSPPPPSPPEEDETRRLEILLDGKVGWIDAQGDTIPVSNLKVTMIDAEGTRTDSVRTNNFGRFLIQHNEVQVGYYWEKHIYVEFSDASAETDNGETQYKKRRILKQINSAPNNKAVLTMDDVVVEKLNK